MPNDVRLKVNGVEVVVPHGSTVAVAMMLAHQSCRVSITGEPRGALCGMGICFACRAVINGSQHCRSCQMMCEEGMFVTTQG